MSDAGILRKLGCPKNVIEHCTAVSKKAMEIAEKVKIEIDRDVIRQGALFHDIGRCKTHGIVHGVVGAEIAKELGLSDEVVRIIERHIGAGITPDEAEKAGLPPRDYTPETPEEKIVAYADNLTGSFSHRTFEESLELFKEKLGEGHPAVKRFIAMHNEIQSWMR